VINLVEAVITKVLTALIAALAVLAMAIIPIKGNKRTCTIVVVSEDMIDKQSTQLIERNLE